MEGWKKLVLAGLTAILIVTTVYIISKGNAEMKEGRFKKIIVLGIDGMDPKVTELLLKEGLLPNFAKLKETGEFSQLETSLPPQSPVAWTSIATGMNPGKHGIFDFISRNPENYIPQLSISKSTTGMFGTTYRQVVEADTFWKKTSESGIKTTVVRWPLSFPPQDSKSKMLSGLGVPDIRGFLSGYTYYTSSEINSDSPGIEKIMPVSNSDTMETYISGPRKADGNNIVEIKAKMRILISKEAKTAKVIVDDREYNITVGNWSEWIRARFEIGTMQYVHCIFRAYLASVEPEFNMYVTAMQINPENPLFQISNPEDYSQELAKDIGLFNTLGMPEDTDALVEGRMTEEVFLQQCAQIEEERDRMFWREFEKFNRSDNMLFVFVYDTSDRIQHIFWDEKLLTGTGSVKLNQNIIDYYTNKDRMLGKILDSIDNETGLIILSDHGFSSFERALTMNTWLVKNGYMTLTTEIDESDEAGLFKNVDWSKTKAYSAGFTSIYLNMQGREKQGIVNEKEKEQLMDEIVQKLESMTDKKTGKNPVIGVYKSNEVYKGEKLKDAPDLIVGFAPGYRMSWQNAVGGVTPDIIFDNQKKWGGDHLIDPKKVPGVLFTNFKTNRETANQMDIAPTILTLLGMEVPEGMDGKPLA